MSILAVRKFDPNGIASKHYRSLALTKLRIPHRRGATRVFHLRFTNSTRSTADIICAIEHDRYRNIIPDAQQTTDNVSTTRSDRAPLHLSRPNDTSAVVASLDPHSPHGRQLMRHANPHVFVEARLHTTQGAAGLRVWRPFASRTGTRASSDEAKRWRWRNGGVSGRRRAGGSGRGSGPGWAS